MRLALSAFAVAMSLSAVAFADPRPPAPAPPAAEKAAPAAEKPARKKVLKQRGERAVDKAEKKEQAAVPTVDVGEQKVAGRSQAPVVHIEIQKMPLTFSLPELVGPMDRQPASN